MEVKSEEGPRAAEPLEPLSPRRLAAILNAPEPAASPEAAQANKKRAADELAALYELKNNRSFQWYEATFITPRIDEARRIFLEPHTKELHEARTVYLTLRSFKADLIQREIEHRRLLNPQDPDIETLRDELLRL